MSGTPEEVGGQTECVRQGMVISVSRGFSRFLDF